MKKQVFLAACALAFPALADIAPSYTGMALGGAPFLALVLGLLVILAISRIRKVWKVLIFTMIIAVWCCDPLFILIDLMPLVLLAVIPIRKAWKAFIFILIATIWCCFPFPIFRSVVFLRRPAVVKIWYADTPIRELVNIRTEIGAYQREKGYLPGLQVRADGTVDATYLFDGSKAISNFTNAGSSNIAPNDHALGVQTFVGDSRHGWLPAVGGLKCGEAAPVWYDAVGVQWKPDMRADWTSPINHFAEHLSIGKHELEIPGGRMQPNHVQYRVLSGGYKAGVYAYAIGVFGNAERTRLAAGTGCAIIEIVNPAAGGRGKFVGTWERYKSNGDEQIVLCTAGESGVADGLQTKDKNICWLGDPTCYLSTDVATVQKAIEQLKHAGWDFDSERRDEIWKRSGLK